MTIENMNTDEQFKQMTDVVIYEETNRLLDRHKDRVRKWKANERDKGNEPTLNDLIKKLMAEPNKRHHVIASLSAALWRIIEQEDRDYAERHPLRVCDCEDCQ